MNLVASQTGQNVTLSRLQVLAVGDNSWAFPQYRCLGGDREDREEA